MKNKTKVSFSVSSFEPISENSENKLIGGFSQSQTSSTMNFNFNVEGNNCQGSNCASNCDGGSIQNTKCNTVTNCGVVLK